METGLEGIQPEVKEPGVRPLSMITDQYESHKEALLTEKLRKSLILLHKAVTCQDD